MSRASESLLVLKHRGTVILNSKTTLATMTSVSDEGQSNMITKFDLYFIIYLVSFAQTLIIFGWFIWTMVRVTINPKSLARADTATVITVTQSHCEDRGLRRSKHAK